MAKTLEDYKALAILWGFLYVLTTIPKNVKIKNKGWRCSNGHECETCYDYIQSGQGCSICSGTKKKTLADYKKLAIEKGFIFIANKIPPNTHTAEKSWKCCMGHEFPATYDNVRADHDCGECWKSNHIITIEDYKTVGNDRGITYILDYIPELAMYNTDKPGWRCPDNHDWISSYAHIKQGSGCPECNRLNRERNLSDYQNIGKEFDISYLLDTIPGTTQEVVIEGWLCKNSHKFSSCYASIREGHGCRHCWKKSITDYQHAAQTRNATYILDYIPDNTSISVKGWKCNICEFIWSASCGAITAKSGCPNCCKGRSENLCRKFLEDIFKTDFPSVRPEFLKYKKGHNLELDCYNETLKLALEYNGQQHYELVKHFHSTIEVLNYQKEKDLWKRNKCKELKIDLIEVPYTYSCSKPDELKEFIYQEIKKVRPNLVLV